MSSIVEGRLFTMAQERATSDDYFTPRWVFDALGLTFDLDVAAPPGGVPWVPAAHYLTQEDDALSQDWHGRVWMNPPYSNVEPWWRRFAEHRNGVCLLPLAKSNWLNRVFDEADAIAIGPQGGEMHFVRDDRPKPLRIWFPVLFAAFSADCTAALKRIGTTR